LIDSALVEYLVQKSAVVGRHQQHGAASLIRNVCSIGASMLAMHSHWVRQPFQSCGLTPHILQQNQQMMEDR
jgi:hypothetical protein